MLTIQTFIDMVIFVGDCPSRLNTDPDVPFVGTLSHVTLLVWLNKMGIKHPIIENSHTAYDINKIIRLQDFFGCKVVALGNNASKRLTKVGIEHFKLPHPSPRNRKLNDKSFIESELNKCKKFLNNCI